MTLGGTAGQVDSSFNYSNTVEGYRRLAEKRIDLFFGAYPSEEQREYAEQNHTTNVARLIDWILSDEGQRIIEETGYSGIR